MIAKVSHEELTRLPISGSASSSSSRLFSPLRDMKNLQDISDDSFAHITVRASDFVRAINEIKPAVAQKNNMLSMIVGSDSTNDGCNDIMDTLVCVGDLQKRLKGAVLPNYLEQTNNFENYNDFDPPVQDKTMRVVGHCSGKFTLCIVGEILYEYEVSQLHEFSFVLFNVNKFFIRNLDPRSIRVWENKSCSMARC